MKPGDRVTWLHSPKRSCLTGWRLQWIPGEIVSVSRRRIRIRVWLRGKERCVNVDPDNVIHEDEELAGIYNAGARIHAEGGPFGAESKSRMDSSYIANPGD